MWTGARSGNTKEGHPYGCLNVGGRSTLVHRLSLELSLGRPIATGLFACHTCDVRLCVRPTHLYEGTASDNARDTVSRGRHHPKVAAADRAAVRADLASGAAVSAVAAHWGLSRRHVRTIRDRVVA